MDLPNNTASLFVLYLIISANYMTPLFSCKIRSFLDNSMIVRHFLGYLTMCFFVVLANQNSPLPIDKLFGISAVLYIWFMLSAKMDVYTWIPFILSIAAIYVLGIYETNIKESDPSKLEKISLAKQILTYVAVGITVIGVFLYYGEKKIEYGNKFSNLKFILGSSVCKQKSPSVSFVEKFTAALTK